MREETRDDREKEYKQSSNVEGYGRLCYQKSLLDESIAYFLPLLPFEPVCEGFRPTIKGLRAGFFGFEVGRVLMLLFRSSPDERLSARCSVSRFVLIEPSL